METFFEAMRSVTLSSISSKFNRLENIYTENDPILTTLSNVIVIDQTHILLQKELSGKQSREISQNSYNRMLDLYSFPEMLRIWHTKTKQIMLPAAEILYIEQQNQHFKYGAFFRTSESYLK